MMLGGPTQEAHEALHVHEEALGELVHWWTSFGWIGFAALVGLLAWAIHKRPWHRRNGR